MNFNYYMPTRILFGSGSISRLSNETLPGKKALIVISAGTSTKKFGYLKKLTDILDNSSISYVIFDKILPNPVKSHVMDGAKVAKDNNCDFVIGLGGGSSIDSAKSIAFMATNPGDYWDYISGGSGKSKAYVNPPLKIVAITTTAGTGTEADPWTVITKEETGEKIGFGYDETFPVISVVDPDLMVTVPADLTAYQGFDALFHSTEGYINNTANPMSDLYSLKAIELIGKSLAIAVKDGSNKDARANVALANTLSGFVESTSGCISEHSIEHAMSGFHSNLPHGAGLIIISIEYYTLFAKMNVCNDRLIDMAKALGNKNANTPMDFVTSLKELQLACGVGDLKMSDYGIKETELQSIAQSARETMGGLFNVDPAPISDDDVLNILKKSYK